MGHAPPPIAPWHLSLDSQIAEQERLRDRRLRWWMPWRRAAHARAVERLIMLREHALYGEHNVVHAGACSVNDCTGSQFPRPGRLPPPDHLRTAYSVRPPLTADTGKATRR